MKSLGGSGRSPLACGRGGRCSGMVGREVPELAGSKETKPGPVPLCKDTWRNLDKLGLIKAEWSNACISVSVAFRAPWTDLAWPRS